MQGSRSDQDQDQLQEDAERSCAACPWHTQPANLSSQDTCCICGSDARPFSRKTLTSCSTLSASLQHDDIYSHTICIVATAVVCMVIVGCNARDSPRAIQENQFQECSCLNSRKGLPQNLVQLGLLVPFCLSRPEPSWTRFRRELLSACRQLHA